MAKILLAALLLLALPAADRPAVSTESAVSVLCYHTFIEKKKMDPYSFTLDEFNAHITQLKKEGFRFVSVGEIFSGRITGTRNVLISIDDGNRSAYDAYQRVLRPNGIRPLLGIYPNIIMAKKKYALTWEQLRELASDGCDIAAHGYYHLKVNRSLYESDPKSFRREIFHSRKVLEENLGRKISVYVYPFGMRDDFTLRAIREAGYRYAFTIDRGRIDVPLAKGSGIGFELPRYMVTRTSWDYCFNRVMKNARPRVSYRVAAADGRGEAPGGPDVKAPDARVADPYRNVEAAVFSVIPHESGPVWGSVDEARPRDKKKFVKNADIASDIRNGADSGTMPVRYDVGLVSGRKAPDRGRSADRMFDPAMPVAALAHETFPAPEKGLPDPAMLIAHAGVLNAGIIAGGADCDARIKARYRNIARESMRAYDVFLKRIKEKIERIRRDIRNYVAVDY
ncbi:MAG: polysaccharide deacetylase family protein [Spirochaetes bacterium]|nr:polysaccharide deacetylase family protein [Spirochaetota bacterium]